MIAAHAKPRTCESCVLTGSMATSAGYAPAVGPPNASLLFVGEALGEREVHSGEPFSGDAGGMLSHLLRRSSIDRASVRIDNVVRCQPPGNWLEGAPWQHSALTSCSQYWQATAAENQYAHRVIVPLGGVALRQVLGLHGVDGVSVKDFHGTVHRLPSGQYVVPTFHPSYLQRGALNLLDVVRFDLDRASAVARDGWSPRPVSTVQDPPVLWFAAWVDRYLAAAAHDPLGTWLAVDIETPDTAGGRDEGELSPDDDSTTILRVNVACHPDEGVTVPYQGPYVTLIERLLAAPYTKCLWNKRYDRPRLLLAGHTEGGEWYDFMWAWHRLQSDVFTGLGFVAPFASDYGAWKHLGKQAGKEAEYGAVDGFQTLRCAFYITDHLIKQGMWEVFDRHTHQLEEIVLRPAYDIGVNVDLPALDAFHVHLDTVCGEKLELIKKQEAAGTLKPKNGYKTKPKGKDAQEPVPPASILGKKKGKEATAKDAYIATGVTLVERGVQAAVRLCQQCGAEGVTDRHRCPVPKPRMARRKAGTTEGDDVSSRPVQPTPVIVTETRTVTRWFWHLPFNPDSPQQLLRYITDSGRTPGRAKKTRKPTSNAETLRKLARSTGDPIYQHILDYRAVKKVDSTYALGVKRRIWADGRIHPEYTFRPSMGRLSYVNPNITNVIQDKGGPESLAAGFRRCITAAPGCRLLEIDYSGSEAVDTGWYLRDPAYIRLARLGVHAYLTSHLIGTPASLDWSDADLAAYFKQIKHDHLQDYDKAKRCVHGNNYGLTIYGMVENFPDVYKDLKDAQRVQDLYYAVAPGLPKWHNTLRITAKRQGYLGGPGAHPFGYKHYFFGVESLRRIDQSEYLRLKARKSLNLVVLDGRPFKRSLGEDSKRVIAFFPQSTTAGKLIESMLLLFDRESPYYIGDQYYGRTPFRAPIHDSLLLEVPHASWDKVVEQCALVMQRPMPQLPCPAEWGIGDYLQTGIEMKASGDGGNWQDMRGVEIPGVQQAAETAREVMYSPEEADEVEELNDLSTIVREWATV